MYGWVTLLNLKEITMKPYGMTNTKRYGKDIPHRTRPILDPDSGNKKKARQENKKIINDELTEIKL